MFFLFRENSIHESQVFVSDDNTVVYFNIRGGKNIEQITLNDTKEAIENNIKSVRTLTSPLHPKNTAKLLFCSIFYPNRRFGIPSRHRRAYHLATSEYITIHCGLPICNFSEIADMQHSKLIECRNKLRIIASKRNRI